MKLVDVSNENAEIRRSQGLHFWKVFSEDFVEVSRESINEKVFL